MHRDAADRKEHVEEGAHPPKPNASLSNYFVSDAHSCDTE